MRLFYINHSDHNDEISPLLITTDASTINGDTKIAVVLTKNYSGYILINGQKIDADFSVSTFKMGDDDAIESFLYATTAVRLDAWSIDKSNGVFSTALGDAQFDIYEMMDALQK